ncbi:complement regulator-acquiring protein (plasmid) [Borreliella yangtzensis]|uniref:Uncharacterized membrane-anchored protein YjiN (DUF445 family) n=1 Tax=Borreliella yangtzensis TaxID=683292 RepID=A0ABR6PAI2_9SPIR|nr:complement regulator-acquiring protein [Borreliella yangtzensis]MBB6043293.1 uncharacterized membrane-anchored protein YjiN (DUF445 family) [Borreliella yangtzensis]WKC73001.1 complement regulator-acquiring protein [Borreliella yangtzensis]WKC73920.1 complement regulator-acquiring protein [Borreliella yangtzensis]
MTNTKLNIIKLSIITAILTLILISCAPVTKIDPNLKENTHNFENASQESQDLGPLKKTNQELEPSNQKSRKTIISELEAIGNTLKDQDKQDNVQIAKIAAEKYDFLDTFKADPDEIIEKDTQLKIKKIIYSSLNYETQKIEILKEILEKLKTNPQHKKIVETFIYHLSWPIQFKIDDCLETINKQLHILDKENSEMLLIYLNDRLKLKQRFAKTLKATIDDYNNDVGNIKTNEEELANHMDANYKDFGSLNPIDD